MDLLEALDMLRAELATVGVRAEIDPRDVNPPGAWLALNAITHNDVMCGGGTVQVYVYLIVPDNGIAQATTQLAELLTSALRVFDPDADTITTSVTLPNAGSGLPALRMTVEVQTD